MSPSAFLDRGSPPARADLERVLGRALPLWDELRERIGARVAPIGERWSYSGRSHGWLLQLRRGNTTVVNLVPGRDCFVASLALNGKACREAEKGGLCESARTAIREGREFPEGRGVRVEVRSRKDIADVEALASLRMAGLR